MKANRIELAIRTLLRSFIQAGLICRRFTSKLLSVSVNTAMIVVSWVLRRFRQAGLLGFRFIVFLINALIKLAKGIWRFGLRCAIECAKTTWALLVMALFAGAIDEMFGRPAVYLAFLIIVPLSTRFFRRRKINALIGVTTEISSCCPKCNAELGIRDGLLRYSCPRCGVSRDEPRSWIKRAAMWNRIQISLGGGFFGAFFGIFVGVAGIGVPGSPKRDPGLWVTTGFLSWTLMIYAGRTARSEEGRLWHKMIFWSILAGAFAIFVRMLLSDRSFATLWGLPTNQDLFAWIAVAMALGAILRWFAARLASGSHL